MSFCGNIAAAVRGMAREKKGYQNMIASITMLMAVILPVPAIIKSIKERVTPFRAVLNGVLSGILAALIVMVAGQVMGVNVFDQMFDAVDTTIKQLTENPEMMAMLGDDASKDQFIETLTYVYETSVKMLPAALCILALLASYAEYIILSKILKPGGIAPVPMTKIQEFDLPRRLVTLWCLIYLAALALSNTDGFADSIVFLNLMTLFNLAFFLQGISVVFMFCHTRKIPRIAAVIFTILMLFLNIGGTLVRLLGFTDLLFGLKYRMKQKF